MVPTGRLSEDVFTPFPRLLAGATAAALPVCALLRGAGRREAGAACIVVHHAYVSQPTVLAATDAWHRIVKVGVALIDLGLCQRRAPMVSRRSCVNVSACPVRNAIGGLRLAPPRRRAVFSPPNKFHRLIEEALADLIVLKPIAERHTFIVLMGSLQDVRSGSGVQEPVSGDQIVMSPVSQLDDSVATRILEPVPRNRVSGR